MTTPPLMDALGPDMDITSDNTVPMEPTRSRRYTKHEWEAHRRTILRMYPKKGVKIRQLKEHLLREHSFSVTCVAPFAWQSNLLVTSQIWRLTSSK